MEIAGHDGKSRFQRYFPVNADRDEAAGSFAVQNDCAEDACRQQAVSVTTRPCACGGASAGWEVWAQASRKASAAA